MALVPSTLRWRVAYGSAGMLGFHALAAILAAFHVGEGYSPTLTSALVLSFVAGTILGFRTFTAYLDRPTDRSLRVLFLVALLSTCGAASVTLYALAKPILASP